MKAVFLDTVGILALFDEDDQWHHGASVAFQRLMQQRMPLVTNEAILLECGNAAARRPYRDDIVDLRHRLNLQNSLLGMTPSDMDIAWQGYAARSHGNAGIVDYLSFIQMQRLGLRSAFTNDKHFVVAGFEILF